MGSEEGTLQKSVIVGDGCFAVGPSIRSKPDLLIRTDPETWLAVLSGRDDSLDRVQAGKLLPTGDVRLLLDLMTPIDDALAMT